MRCIDNVTVGRDIAARRLTMCENHGLALQLAYGIACLERFSVKIVLYCPRRMFSKLGIPEG